MLVLNVGMDVDVICFSVQQSIVYVVLSVFMIVA